MLDTEQIAGKAVLITGGTGFIGTRLCQRLASCGASLHIVTRKLRRSSGEHLRWWQVDLGDVESVRQVFKVVRPQVVFHLASLVVGAREVQVVLPTFYSNLATTVHILTAAAEAGCQRVILAGSSEEPQIVDSSTFACSPYAAAKWGSNVYGSMFYRLFGVPVVMPRIFMTYGPNQTDTQKLVPFAVLSLLRGKAPELGSGRRLADWIYVDDVVEGLLRAALIPGIEGCAFDLGSGLLVSNREIVERIVEIIGTSIRPAFGALPDRPFEQERPADTTFLSRRLEFKPETTLSRGLEATITWYRQQLRSAVDKTEN